MSRAEEKLKKVIDSIVQEKFPEASDVRIKPMSTQGANFSSALFDVTVISPGEIVELFAKVAIIDDKLISITNHMFDTEHFVYKTLSSAYEKLQDKHGCTERFIFPQSYKKNAEGIPIMVMENLAAKGYECLDRFKSIDWKYASNCVETLARFHALSLAFKNEHKQEFKEVENALKLPKMPEGPEWEGFADAALAAIDEDDREKLSRLLEGSVGWSKQIDFGNPCKTSIVIHGDYRPSNLMHKEINGEYRIIPVDYQTARIGCPASDLIYFIVLSSDQQFRQKYYHQLVEHYYEQLALAMTKLGLKPDEVYGREEFESDMREKLPIGLCVAARTLPFVTVDPACAPSIDHGDFVPRASEVFAERFRALMQDFKLWGFI